MFMAQDCARPRTMLSDIVFHDFKMCVQSTLPGTMATVDNCRLVTKSFYSQKLGRWDFGKCFAKKILFSTESNHFPEDFIKQVHCTCCIILIGNVEQIFHIYLCIMLTAWPEERCYLLNISTTDGAGKKCFCDFHFDRECWSCIYFCCCSPIKFGE